MDNEQVNSEFLAHVNDLQPASSAFSSTRSTSNPMDKTADRPTEKYFQITILTVVTSGTKNLHVISQLYCIKDNKGTIYFCLQSIAIH